MGDKDQDACTQGFLQPLIGVIWVIGWWFTIGLAKLIWWKAMIAIIFWPYYLGAALR